MCLVTAEGRAGPSVFSVVPPVRSLQQIEPQRHRVHRESCQATRRWPDSTAPKARMIRGSWMN